MCSFKDCQSAHGKNYVHSPSFLNLSTAGCQGILLILGKKSWGSRFCGLLYGQSMRINITVFVQQIWILKIPLKFHVVFYSRFVPKCDPKSIHPKNEGMSELCWHVADRIGICKQQADRDRWREGLPQVPSQWLMSHNMWVLEISTWIKRWGIPIKPIIFKQYDTGFRFCGWGGIFVLDIERYAAITSWFFKKSNSVARHGGS